MKKYLYVFAILILLLLYCQANAQSPDSLKRVRYFSGSFGVTNNGFSIIPSFSLNSPAVNAFLSWRRSRFSIDPDIRLTPDMKRGSIILWFRWYAIQKSKFTLRMGLHPAYNLQLRAMTNNGITTKITQARRFVAWELAPSIAIKKNWLAGVYYLQSNGLQKDGPRTAHFVTLNSSINGIKAGGNFRLAFMPAVYYLYLDGYAGEYFTATAIISHNKLPFTLESSVNKTISSNLPGNKNFMWNLAIRYNFKKVFLKIRQ